MPFSDVIVLGSGHALIMGHVPDKIKNELILARNADAARFAEIEKLGFFDSYAPGLNNYYPEVTAEDFVVKDGDLAKPLVRALSEVIVHKSWNPVDFSINGVLKKSVKLLEAQTVYVNHDAIVGNELGSVASAFWEDSYKTKGIIIPAGINARLAIDAKSNPKIVRGMNMQPPSVHSLSVTVGYMWEKSHDVSEDDFFRKLGTYDADGKMFRKIATKISRYNELSFVAHGADPYAQIYTPEGVINNPKFAEASSNSEKSKQTYFFVDFQNPLSEGYFDVTKNEDVPPPTIPSKTKDIITEHQNQFSMKREALLALALVLGITPEADITDEALSGMVSNSVKELKNTSVSLSATKTTLETEKTQLTQQVTSLKEFQDARLAEKRSEIVADYLKLMGDKKDDATVTMLNGATWEVLTSFAATYKTQLDEKFPLECGDCHSHNVSRASATPADPNNPGNKGKGTFDSEAFVNQKLKESSITLPSMREEPKSTKS